MASKCRQQYHVECEAAVNKQINMELHASYCYLSLAAHFGRDDVDLKGLQKYFADSSKEEKEHAVKFIDYQSLRGGRVVFQPVSTPTQQEWDTPLAAMEYALSLEKEVSESILKMRALAETHADPHLCHFLDHEFIDEQAQAVFKLAGIVTNMERVGGGLGIFIFDQEFQ